MKAVKIISRARPGVEVNIRHMNTHVLKFPDIPKLEMVKFIYDFTSGALPKPLQALFDINEIYVP